MAINYNETETETIALTLPHTSTVAPPQSPNTFALLLGNVATVQE